MVTKIPLGPGGTPYSQGIKSGGGTHTVFISGQLAKVDLARGQAPDLGAQAREIFTNMQALLKEAGGSLADVVKITTFVTTLEGYAEYGKIRREFFTEPYPASSTVQVSALVVPGCVIEIEAVAVI